MAADALELRPLRVGEILDAGIKITTKRFAPLAKLVAVVTIPIQVLSAFVILSTTSDEAFSSTTVDDASELWTQLAGNLVVTVLGFLGTLIALAACTRIVAGAYFGEDADWRDSLRYAGRRFPSLLWLGFLYGLMVTLGLVACLVPGIWLAVAYALAVPALLIEDARGADALRRSFRLVRRRWWPTFGVLLLGLILINVVQTMLSLPLIPLLVVGDGDPNPVVFVAAATISGTVGTVLTTPFLVAMLVVVYVDLRVRKEGLDLQLLAQRVGAPAPAAGSVPQWAGGTATPGTAPPPGWSPPPPPDRPATPPES